MSINIGGTLANTGGTAKVFANDGVSVPNGVHVSVPGTADFRVREHATFRYKAPALQPDGTWSRGSYTASITVPKALSGTPTTWVNNVVRISVDLHPESTSTEGADLRKLAAQLLFDSDTDNFWTAGSLE